MTSSAPAAALAGAVEQLLAALVRQRAVLGDVEPSPLSTFQAIALGVLVDRGPLRLGALADELRTTDATASRTIDALEEEGLAGRQHDPTDRRGVLVAATPGGEEAVSVRRARAAQLLESLVAGMDPADGERLVAVLAELSELLERR
ncbi:MAG: MarR family winged helix-turn-helix transcriptional regulator [Gaiella sp.]